MSLKFKSPVIIKGVAATFVLGVCLFAQNRVEAQSEGGALVLHGCPDSSTFPGKSEGYVYDVCADIVFTPSGNIEATLHGELLDPSTAPSRTVVVTGFPCEYNNEITHDSQIVITPDGNVNGYCRLQAK